MRHAYFILLLFVFYSIYSGVARAQEVKETAVIVQPGAPGQPTRVLPGTTRASLPPTSRKDVEFMQGMIHHHSQAVEMVDLMASRTANEELRRLGARIGHSQAEEMRFMERWLAVRGEPVSASAHSRSGDHSHHHGAAPGSGALMPGMLTTAQMDALRSSKGRSFDTLFLNGMIQHHEGALVMVKELFEAAGAAQDSEVFNFATDVDSGQRAEIKRMRTLLEEMP